MDRQNYFALLIILLINFVSLFAITFNLVNYTLELFVSVLLLIAAVGLVYSFYKGKSYARKYAILFFGINLINIAFLFTAISTSLLLQALIVLIVNIIGFSYSVNSAAQTIKKIRHEVPVELPRTISLKEEPISEVYSQYTRPAARVVAPSSKPKRKAVKKAKKKTVKKKAKKSQKPKVSGKLKKQKAFSTKATKKKAAKKKKR